MTQSGIMLKIKLYLGSLSTAFNPTWKAYKLLAGGVLFLCFSLWSSYDKYRHQEIKRIRIENVAQMPSEITHIDGGLVEVSQKSELLLKPQSYSQQLLFDLDPNTDDVFSLSFALLFVVLTMGLFFVLKNTSKSFEFSKNVLNSLISFAL